MRLANDIVEPMIEPAHTVFGFQYFRLETADMAMEPLPAALQGRAGGGSRLARVTGEEMNMSLRHTAKDEEIDDCAERASGKTRPFVGYGKLRFVGLLEKQRCYGRIYKDFSMERMANRAQRKRGVCVCRDGNECCQT